MWKGVTGSLGPCGGGGIAGMVVGSPAHHIVQPQGLRTMPDPPPPQGGPEYPQGVQGPYPQHQPHHYQRHHHQRPHDHRHQHHPHHYQCPPPYPTGPQPPVHEQHQRMGWQPTSAPPAYPTYHQGPPPPYQPPPLTRNRIPPATTSTPKGPPGPNPARDSHSTNTTSRCRHHTPTWRIHGQRGTSPPPPSTRRHHARPPGTR